MICDRKYPGAKGSEPETTGVVCAKYSEGLTPYSKYASNGALARTLAVTERSVGVPRMIVPGKLTDVWVCPNRTAISNKRAARILALTVIFPLAAQSVHILIHAERFFVAIKALHGYLPGPRPLPRPPGCSSALSRPVLPFCDAGNSITPMGVRSRPRSPG